MTDHHDIEIDPFSTFLIWAPGRGQTQADAQPIMAFTAQQAAEMWGDWYDVSSGEYPLVSGEALVVDVLGQDWEQPQRFVLIGETMRHYQARLLRIVEPLIH